MSRSDLVQSVACQILLTRFPFFFNYCVGGTVTGLRPTCVLGEVLRIREFALVPPFIRMAIEAFLTTSSNDRPPLHQLPFPSFARHFSEMRQHTRLSIDEVAGWLNTTPDVISAAEAGAVQRLPLWPEISRIVTAYATPLGIDPNALLHLIAVSSNT